MDSHSDGSSGATLAAFGVTTLFPVVAVTLGALFADEQITIELVLGGALVLIAVYVGALSGPTQDPTDENLGLHAP